MVKPTGRGFPLKGGTMNSTQEISKFDLVQALRGAVDLLAQSSNAQDLCRRVTHAEVFNGLCRGVAIYLLDQRSSLVQVAGYGSVPEDSQIQISAWDESFLSKGVRSRQTTFEKTADEMRVCLPVEVAGVVTGALQLSFAKEIPITSMNRDDTKLLANLVGLFMDTKGVTFGQRTTTPTPVPAPDEIAVQELTTRQVQILHFVADGLTNAEISKLVLLSESTVRQETIRIFRILKCHTRSEAIVKARANGIIARVPKVNELTEELA